MPTRCLLISSRSADRLEKAAEQFRALARQSDALVLGENRGAAADFVREASESAGGFLGVHCLTLRRAASLLASEASGGGPAPLSRLGVEAVAARCVASCRLEGSLEYFSRVADTPGFARALASTLTELRLEGVRPEVVEAAGPPGRDLARLLERYERELQEQGLADAATAYSLAREAVEGGHRLAGLALVLLDLSVTSQAADALLDALVRRAPAVIATEPAGDEESIRALETILGVTAERIDGAAGPPALRRIQQYLFQYDIPPGEEPDASFGFFSAASESWEAVEIARRILRLAGEDVPFDRMAVLLRNPAGYLPLVEDALRRAGIPAYFTRSARRPDPAGRAFLALLACAAEGLTASRFAEYLSLGQAPREARAPEWTRPEDEALESLKPAPPEEQPVPPPPEDEDDAVVGGTLQTPFLWEKLLVDAAVIGGHDRWARRLAGLGRQYQLRLAALDQEGDPRREYYQRELRRLRNLEAFALPLIERLGSWPAKALWKDWIEQLAELAGLALRDPEPVWSVLSELRPMGEVGPVGLDEVRTVLQECLGSLRPAPAGNRFGRVFVGSVEEARGRSFDVVFVPGLAEGLFPRQALEDPLLLDEARAGLPARLAVEDRRVARERLLLQAAAGAARLRLYASYPRLDVTLGRPRVPSFYALELWRAALGRLPDLKHMEKQAARAASTQMGWPAPVDTAEAIDDAEYDLAYLSGLLRERREMERGASHYLLASNPHLKRSLRARARRWRPRWFGSDGIVDPDEAARRILAGYSVRSRAYSPTALQQFAACPYKFLLYSIHRLRPRERTVAIEQLDPLDRGSLFHDAQREFFRELQAAGGLPITPEQVEQALGVADRVLNRVAAEYEEKLAPAIEPVWRTAIEELRIDLRGWILELLEVHAEWLPERFEFSFGLPAEEAPPGGTAADEAVILDGARVRGRIDLVERHRLHRLLRVTDHKTGKPPDPAPVSIGRGEHLQPVLYGLAAEQLLGTPVDSGILFYATQRGGYRQLRIALDRGARQRAAWALETIDACILEGFLPAAPKKDACQYCDYRPVCGPYEERRVAKKDQSRLERLHGLRSQP